MREGIHRTPNGLYLSVTPEMPVCLVAYHGNTTEQGGERFRLRMSIQGKRAEEFGTDLVNHVP